MYDRVQLTSAFTMNYNSRWVQAFQLGAPEIDTKYTLMIHSLVSELTLYVVVFRMIWALLD